MVSKILPILNTYIKTGDIIIVGISGGPDSTALLHILSASSTEASIIVAHVNHGIRGKESDRDETFVKKLAESYGLRCEVKRVKLKGESHLEEKGREVRREFFEKLRKKYRAKWIITAHTEDDQLETIIFNFLRGSGPAGLAGMKVVNGFYLKPFLGISKKEILAYLRRKKYSYCYDSTNEDTKFRRNLIRRKILPLLLKINPSLRKTLLRNRKIFANLDSLLQQEARNFMRAHGASASKANNPALPVVSRSELTNKRGCIIFPLREYEKLPEALQSTVIQEAYRSRTGNHFALPNIKVEEVVRMLRQRIGNKKIICSGGGTFLLRKGEVEFS